MTGIDTTTQTIFYDIFNYEVIQIELVSRIDDTMYYLALNKTTNTPIKVWHGRLNELFKTEYDANIALRDVLMAKIQIVSEKIGMLTPIKSTD